MWQITGKGHFARQDGTCLPSSDHLQGGDDVLLCLSTRGLAAVDIIVLPRTEGRGGGVGRWRGVIG